jgi:hypothetical protein
MLHVGLIFLQSAWDIAVIFQSQIPFINRFTSAIMTDSCANFPGMPPCYEFNDKWNNPHCNGAIAEAEQIWINFHYDKYTLVSITIENPCTTRRLKDA